MRLSSYVQLSCLTPPLFLDLLLSSIFVRRCLSRALLISTWTTRARASFIFGFSRSLFCSIYRLPSLCFASFQCRNQIYKSPLFLSTFGSFRPVSERRVVASRGQRSIILRKSVSIPHCLEASPACGIGSRKIHPYIRSR